MLTGKQYMTDKVQEVSSKKKIGLTPNYFFPSDDVTHVPHRSSLVSDVPHSLIPLHKIPTALPLAQVSLPVPGESQIINK